MITHIILLKLLKGATATADAVASAGRTVRFGVRQRAIDLGEAGRTVRFGPRSNTKVV